MLTKPVLLVEDDESVREMVADYLRAEGYTVLEAADGAAALALLRGRQADEPSPGAVVLDLMLPVVNGLAVLERLATTAPEVPVIVMSAYEGLLAAAATERAAGILLKPFDLDQLLPMVARHCGISAPGAD